MWTDVPKPTSSTWSAVAVYGKEIYDSSSPYDSSVAYDGSQVTWNSVQKPTASSWVSVPKPV